MKQDRIAPPSGRGSVTLVQARDRGGGRAEQLVVARRTLSRGIAPVREQREAQIAVGTRQIMNLQTLDLLFEFRLSSLAAWALTTIVRRL